MITLPHAILSALRANARASRLHEQRDEHFEPLAPLSLWSDTARRMGAIVLAEAELRRITDSRNGNELPPPLDDRGAG